MSHSRKSSKDSINGRRTPAPAWAEKGNSTLGDVESQKSDSKSRRSAALEHGVDTRTKFLYLGSWFALNLILTLYNKSLLQGLRFPWLLTALHTSCVSIGCYVLLLGGHFKLSTLTTHDNLVLVGFSFLFTFNIAISNVSLAHVSIPFHQILRSLCPLFTLLLSRLLLRRSYPPSTYFSLLPLTFGVALATYGDYTFTTLGFFLTLLGVLLASLKTVLTNALMTGSLRLPALELLLRMSPLAAVQSLAMARATGEMGAFATHVSLLSSPTSLSTSTTFHPYATLLLSLLGNGILAFLLNISSFATNRAAGALTLTVAGNLKQCVTVLLGIVLFNVQVGVVNGVGMVVTLAGAAWYSKVELDTKGRR